MKVLAIGAHPDDLEIGCFATLLLHRAAGDTVRLLVMTCGESGGEPGRRRTEARAAAAFLGADLSFGGLPDTRLEDNHPTIGIIEEHVGEFAPDIIYVNSDKDRHQDHRNLARACQSAARQVDQLFMYETPSTLREFAPQLFVDVTEHFARKLEALERHESQLHKMPRLEDALRGLATFRAYQAGFVGGLAEAFEVVRIVRGRNGRMYHAAA